MSRIDDCDSLDKGLFGRHGRGPHLGVVEHCVVAAAVVVLAGDDHAVGPLVVIVVLLAGGVEGVGRDDGAPGAAGGRGRGSGGGRACHHLLGKVAQVGAVRGVDVRLLAVEERGKEKVNKTKWNE